MKKIFLLLLFAGKLFFSSAQNPGDTLFNSSLIHNINITFTQSNFWDSLMHYKQHADSFNLSTPSMMGNIYVDGTLIDSVGISLKGNSSFGFPGRKKPIKISFNKYVAGKKLEGLTVLDLNNNMLDPTMMREKLLLDFMNKKGLPAPRCTYAKVSYNGQYVGLYKMLEQIDKEFIKTHFNDWGGNLFKGDPQGTLNWVDSNPASYYNFYELHSNSATNNWNDLVHLIDYINHLPAAIFYDTLETHLNTTPLIQQWAARNLFVDLDAYFHAPHNYYLYDDSLTNKFQWITWDVSVAFGFYPMWSEDSTEHTSILHSTQPLTNRMLANSNYKTTYLNTICDYLDYLDTTVMSPIIDSLANKIYPAFAAEPDSNQMFPEQALFWTCDTMTVHTPIGDIPGLKKFIVNRRNIVLNQLAAIPFTCTNGIHDMQKSDFDLAISPNPFHSQTTIRIFAQKNANADISVFNMMGELIDKIKIQLTSGENTIKWTAPAGVNGVLFFKVDAGNVILSNKIVVLR